MRFLGIAVAGALGALARYGVDGWIARRGGSFPWGTFIVNVSGAFLLGLVFTLLTKRAVTPAWVRTAVTIGFLGAYTTFSTLTFETYRLVEDGAVLLGAANAVGSLAIGLVAVYGGVVLGRVI